MMPLFLGTSKSGRGSPRLSPTTNVLLAAQALYRSALGGMHHTESPTTWSAARAGCGGAARRKVDRRSAARRAVPIVVAVVDGTTEMRIRAKEEMVSPTALPQRAFGPGNRRDQKLPPVRLEQRLLNKHDLSSASSATPSNSNHILSAALVEIFFCEWLSSVTYVTGLYDRAVLQRPFQGSGVRGEPERRRCSRVPAGTRGGERRRTRL
jgi:hypothetical protein